VAGQAGGQLGDLDERFDLAPGTGVELAAALVAEAEKGYTDLFGSSHAGI
jgi:hypothetical protein